jgi:hypothetical protein
MAEISAVLGEAGVQPRDGDGTPFGEPVAVIEAIKQNNTDRVRFHDPSGRVWARPAHRKTWESKITVTGPDGRELGLITQRNVMGRVRFDVTAGGRKLAQLRSPNTRLAEFGITDHTGSPVGRLLKLGNYASWRLLRDAKAIGRYGLDLPMRHRPRPAPLAVAGRRPLGPARIVREAARMARRAW